MCTNRLSIHYCHLECFWLWGAPQQLISISFLISQNVIVRSSAKWFSYRTAITLLTGGQVQTENTSAPAFLYSRHMRIVHIEQTMQTKRIKGRRQHACWQAIFRSIALSVILSVSRFFLNLQLSATNVSFG